MCARVFGCFARQEKSGRRTVVIREEMRTQEDRNADELHDSRLVFFAYLRTRVDTLFTV